MIPPPYVTGAILHHLGGAMRQLKSYATDGPTVYALTIFGLKGDSKGAATLAGPALDPDGLAAGWPAEARDAACAVFRRPGIRRAGGVTVIAIVQTGRVSHCALVSLPGDTPRRSRPPRAQRPPGDAQP